MAVAVVVGLAMVVAVVALQAAEAEVGETSKWFEYSTKGPYSAEKDSSRNTRWRSRWW